MSETAMPVITAVYITPNPVNMNTAFTISVSVTDAALTAEERYCGVPYCGEV